MALGKQIKRYRDQLGWTLEELEERSGVAVGTISALEIRDSVRSKYAPAIAKAFGLSLEQLLDDTQNWLEATSRRIVVNDQVVSISARGALELCQSYEAADRARQVVADLAIGRYTPRVSDALVQAVRLAISLAEADFPGGKEHKATKRNVASVS